MGSAKPKHTTDPAMRTTSSMKPLATHKLRLPARRAGLGGHSAAKPRHRFLQRLSSAKQVPGIVCFTLAAWTLCQAGLAGVVESGARRQLLDDGWKFNLGDDGDSGAAACADAAWRTVDLPHDWSIEGKLDKTAPMGGDGGFFPAGVGWYRRSFAAPAEWRGKRVSVEFDGVHMNADVWLNGRHLGTHPYGYTGFFMDLTPHLKPGEKNVLAVRVDNSKQKNSRWYSGSGIYRHVWLTATAPLHVAPWGVHVTTPKATAENAVVMVQTRMINESEETADVTLQTVLLGPDGKEAGRTASKCVLAAGGTSDVKQEIGVPKPALWSPETPHLYRAVVRIIRDLETVDETEVNFGIRALAWSAEKGFMLNGRKITFCGGCMHHDNGCLGAAAFDRAEQRRVEIMKAAGFNAIRTAHNPPSSAFLDACDRLGMLVIDEAFDCWEKGKRAGDYGQFFKEWWQRDIDAMVLRDRNHPSVIMWSIGNEIPWPYAERTLEVGKDLADRIRMSDSSRPVTQGFELTRPKQPRLEPWDKYCESLDIVGYNYGIAKGIGEDHPRVPSRVMFSSESYPRDMFAMWEQTQSHAYVLGDFVWTAWDYIGENGIGRWEFGKPKNGWMASDDLWPWHGATCGDIDSTGWLKFSAHYRNIVWDRGEQLYLGVLRPCPAGTNIWVQDWGLHPVTASWTWPGFEGKPVKVAVFSRADSVRLYQDGKLAGERPTTAKEQFKAEFDITYTPGVLKAVGMRNGEAICEQTLLTAGKPSGLKLTADRPVVHATGSDLAYITVEVVDKNGLFQPNADNQITFNVEGPGVIAGVDNGDMRSEEPYHANQRKAFNGRALVVIRSSRNTGTIRVSATGNGLQKGEAVITSE